jgi:thiol-disulfide isomerase/thioredoxin
MRRRDSLIGGGAALGIFVLQRHSRAAAVGAPQAPEFVGLDGWLNTEAALSIAGLRGKVVLVDFWTYSCINCRRTIPYLNRWQADYGARGLQVIGIHTPEFHFEHARTNVAADVQALGIRYPVAQDNAFATWKAWSNRAWPAFYLLDQQGQIVLVREGEGYAAEMEGAIRGLLGLAGSAARRHPGDDPDLSRVGTPEMYFGALHPTPQDRNQSPRKGLADYSFRQATDPQLNTYALEGTWERDMEPLVLRSGHGGLRLRFSASTMHLVASAPTPAQVQVRVDGGAPTNVEIGRPTLYTLFEGDRPGEHRLDLQADVPGLTLFSATFG